jgi:transmembrane sensor
MTRTREPKIEEALTWLIRTNDPEFQDWEAFTDWLERDPTNADAYHRLAGRETDLLAQLEKGGAVRDALRPSPVPRRFAIAASLAVLAAAGTTILVPRLTPQSYVTAPGEQRTITLAEGDQLVMNGGTRLEVAGFDRRTVRLTEGEILVRLQGPANQGLKVTSGDLLLTDIGTVFDVVRIGTLTSVAVSEGAIVADPSGARLVLRKGDRLDARDGDRILRPMRVDEASIGAWTGGQLVYRSEPVGRVIGDLRRTTGIDFTLQDDMGPRQFTGTLAIAEIRNDPQALGPLLGLDVKRAGDRWMIAGGATN